MDKLVINNLSGADQTILGHVISDSSSYTVGDADLVTFAKDAYLKTLIWQSLMSITVYGYALPTGFGSAGDMWLAQIANGQIVYS